MEADTLTTKEAAAYLGWPATRLHDIAFVLPEFGETRTGGKGGRGNQNTWSKSMLDTTKLLADRFDLGVMAAARIACMSRRDGNLVIIDLTD